MNDADWIESGADPRKPHKLRRGGWELIAYESGDWELWCGGVGVDNGVATLPTLECAQARVVQRASEVAAVLAPEIEADLRGDVRALRDCIRALLPDRTALGALALELYPLSRTQVGVRIVVTMPLHDRAAEEVLARALRHEIERAVDRLSEALNAALRSRNEDEVDE